MVLSLLLTLLLTGAGLLQQRRTRRELGALDRSLQRVAAAMLEQARAETQRESLRQVQRAAEKTVHLGASTVRTLHMGIAAIPFGILEAIPATRDTSRLVREVHDQISDVVYDSITGTNRLFGSLLRRSLLPRPQDEDGGGGKEESPAPP